MRRSTAAAVGTLTGAALIVGVRLSVQPPAAPVAAQAPVDLANAEPAPKESSKKPAKDGAKKGEQPEKTQEAAKNGLKNGVFKGKGSTNPYGTIQVSIRIDNGKITAATATYPLTGDSATINPPAIATLKQETLTARTAEDVAAVSGATYTTKSYKESLQAALDAAKA
jgi:uncharacterized protein with FMN-binding domain